MHRRGSRNQGVSQKKAMASLIPGQVLPGSPANLRGDGKTGKRVKEVIESVLFVWPGSVPQLRNRNG